MKPLGILSFPITAKLNPIRGGHFNADNIRYLAESAVLTRLMIGLVRVAQNRPNKNKDPELSFNDKKKTFFERVFVEIIGTLGYLGVLHMGQDFTAKAFESMKKYNVNHHLQNADWYEKLNKGEKQKFDQAVDKVFGRGKWGRIHNVLYGEGSKAGNQLNALKKRLDPKLYAKVEAGMEPFVRRLHRATSASILGGVATSALFGGLVIQWVNDRLISPSISVILDEFANPGGSNGGSSQQQANGDRFQKFQATNPPAPQVMLPPVTKAEVNV